MSTDLAKKSADGFKPGWTKLLSEGHVWVARLNELPLSKSFAPMKVKIIGIAAVAAFVAGGFAALVAVPTAIGKVAASAGESSSVASKTEVVLESSVREMLSGAVSDGRKAKLFLNGEQIRHADMPNDGMLISAIVDEIVAGKGAPDYIQFPEIGQPWPSDGQILVKQVGDVSWIGIRFATPRGDAAWLGVIRQVAKKNTLFAVSAPLPGIAQVSPVDIPRAVIAAGFGRNGALPKNVATDGDK